MTKTRSIRFSRKRRRGGRKTVKRRGGRRRSKRSRGGKRRSRVKHRGGNTPSFDCDGFWGHCHLHGGPGSGMYPTLSACLAACKKATPAPTKRGGRRRSRVKRRGGRRRNRRRRGGETPEDKAYQAQLSQFKAEGGLTKEQQATLGAKITTATGSLTNICSQPNAKQSYPGVC